MPISHKIHRLQSFSLQERTLGQSKHGGIEQTSAIWQEGSRGKRLKV